LVDNNKAVNLAVKRMSYMGEGIGSILVYNNKWTVSFDHFVGLTVLCLRKNSGDERVHWK
jgi:hypothetical protein